jgi:hypothetical protein
MNQEKTMSNEFTRAFDGIEATVEFNPKWTNGTGYYNKAVDGDQAPSLTVGQIVKCATPAPNNRRMILIGTQFGNVVLFDRFTNAERGVVVHNAPDEVKTLVGGMSSDLSDGTIRHLVGDVYRGTSHNNIGYKIKKVFEAWGTVEA